MKYTFPAILFATLLTTSGVHALDFGSLMQQAAPAADAVMANTSVGSNPLIKNLTSSLGVTPSQAVGGTAALLGEAKKDMKPADFNSLSSSIPAVGSLMSAVPVGSGTLTSQFAKYGLKPEMIDKFTPFLTDYISTGSTPAMGKLVEAALK